MQSSTPSDTEICFKDAGDDAFGGPAPRSPSHSSAVFDRRERWPEDVGSGEVGPAIGVASRPCQGHDGHGACEGHSEADVPPEVGAFRPLSIWPGDVITISSFNDRRSTRSGFSAASLPRRDYPFGAGFGPSFDRSFSTLALVRSGASEG